VPPVIPPVTEGADQLYVVPAGTMPLVTSTGVMEKAVALHDDPVRLSITGHGFTVTVTVNKVPVQLPATGVTVYTASRGELVLFVSVP